MLNWERPLQVFHLKKIGMSSNYLSLCYPCGYTILIHLCGRWISQSLVYKPLGQRLCSVGPGNSGEEKRAAGGYCPS